MMKEGFVCGTLVLLRQEIARLAHIVITPLSGPSAGRILVYRKTFVTLQIIDLMM
jgi:hypothetical protein